MILGIPSEVLIETIGDSHLYKKNELMMVHILLI